MRKWNAIISILILVLFLVHGIAGCFQLIGWMPGGMQIPKLAAWLLIVLIFAHMGNGCVLTRDTLKALKASKASYWKENRLFWIRRISGFAVMLLILIHMVQFMQVGNEVFRLNVYDIPQLILQLLFIGSLVIHILCNIRPLFLSFGNKGREAVTDIMLILAGVLLFGAVAMIIYYFRWNVFWR